MPAEESVGISTVSSTRLPPSQIAKVARLTVRHLAAENSNFVIAVMMLDENFIYYFELSRPNLN